MDRKFSGTFSIRVNVYDLPRVPHGFYTKHYTKLIYCPNYDNDSKLQIDIVRAFSLGFAL